MFVRGVAVGAILVVTLSFLRGGASRHARIATVLSTLSVAAWMITESQTLWGALEFNSALLFLAYPVAGLFWLFVVTVFEDRPLSAASLSPAALLLVAGVVSGFTPMPIRDWFGRREMLPVRCCAFMRRWSSPRAGVEICWMGAAA
jgi:hypothetical protein